MNTFFNYLIEANIGIILFLLVYRVLLKNETNFSFRRYYLLASLAISIGFPLVTISGPSSIPSISQIVSVYWLPELTVGTLPTIQVSTSTTVSLWSVILYLYIVGAALFISKIALEFYRLFQLVNKSEQSQNIIYINSNIVAFSFFRFMFISRAYEISPSDKVKIIDHEKVHQHLGHSFDILAIELIRILFWFNPLISLYKKDISTVHEFQADERAIQNTQETQTYCNLLARVALKSAGFTLANHFNNSLTLKRIDMINHKKKKMQWWKLAMILPLAVGFLFLVACQDQVLDDIKDASKSASMTTDIPAQVQTRVQELQNKNPERNYIVLRFDSKDYDKMKKLEESNLNVSSVEVIKIYENDFEKTGNFQSYVIIEKSEQTSQLAEVTKTDDEIFLVVEEAATPIEGIKEYYKKIASIMKYPSEARRKGISGKVFVEFVIEKDGTLSDMKVLKGIGDGCDEEAIRAIKEAGLLWNPGKQKDKPVKQRMVMPVIFSLGS